jgi:hypothetical protein
MPALFFLIFTGIAGVSCRINTDSKAGLNRKNNKLPSRSPKQKSLLAAIYSQRTWSRAYFLNFLVAGGMLS